MAAAGNLAIASRLSTSLEPGLTGRVLRWLAPRLAKPVSLDSGTPPNQALQRTCRAAGSW